MENPRPTRINPDGFFDEADALRLHQLRLLEWMATAGRKRFVEDVQQTPPHDALGVPELWKLTMGIDPGPGSSSAS